MSTGVRTSQPARPGCARRSSRRSGRWTRSPPGPWSSTARRGAEAGSRGGRIRRGGRVVPGGAQEQDQRDEEAHDDDAGADHVDLVAGASRCDSSRRRRRRRRPSAGSLGRSGSRHDGPHPVRLATLGSLAPRRCGAAAAQAICNRQVVGSTPTTGSHQRRYAVVPRAHDPLDAVHPVGARPMPEHLDAVITTSEPRAEPTRLLGSIGVGQLTCSEEGRGPSSPPGAASATRVEVEPRARSTR